MTVLAKYQRLEAEGIWRPAPDTQRRDVIVAIGDATITISAGNGTALTHWSLPAIERLNPGEPSALYRPGPDSPETLEIAEGEMIEAVEKVLRSIRKGGSKSTRTRRFTTIGAGLAILVAAAIWMPQAIIRYTASLVPDVARAAIGQQVLGEMDRVAGAPCSVPSGRRALVALEDRLFNTSQTKVVVLSSTLNDTAHLPGGIILVSHTLVEDFETPEVLAGYLLAEDLRRKTNDPLAKVLDFAGFRAALGLLLQGKVSPDALKRMAEHVVSETPMGVSDSDLIARFASADVSPKPYSYARDFTGETTATLIQSNDETGAPILDDGDWIALQRICEDENGD